MAWAIQFDGVNDYMTLNSELVIPSDTPFDLEFYVFPKESTTRFLGRDSSFNSRVLAQSTTQMRMVSSGGTNYQFTMSGWTLNEWHKVLFSRDEDNLITLEIDNILQASSFNTGVDFFFNVLSKNSSSASSEYQLGYLNLKLIGIPEINLDATASSHAAGTPILTDTIGGNDATGVNMPTDGSAWVDLGGGGLTVTGATPSLNYSSIAAGTDLTGSIDITGQTANYTYSAANGTIDLTGDILVAGTTASYNYQSINAAVDLTGEITVIGSTASQSYSSVNGIIELGAVISVVGLTPNYNYQGIAGEVSLNGEILVSGETPSYSYSAIKGFVTTGEAQVIGTVTSSFASDVYSSGFKPNTITVNFKS